MTEAEAKEKGCCGPPALAMLLAANLGTAPPSGVKPGNCVGSACMGWRRGRPFGSQATDQGSCGLAGQPIGAVA